MHMKKQHPLRAYRKARKMTAEQLGKVLGFAAPTINSFENGNRTIMAEDAVKIEKLTGINRAQLRPDLWAKAA